MAVEYTPGELVALHAVEPSQVAVVSAGPTEDGSIHVLSLSGDRLVGHEVGIEDIGPVSDDLEGYAQLAGRLIKLGSHIIENRLLIYKR